MPGIAWDIPLRLASRRLAARYGLERADLEAALKRLPHWSVRDIPALLAGAVAFVAFVTGMSAAPSLSHQDWMPGISSRARDTLFVWLPTGALALTAWSVSRGYALSAEFHRRRHTRSYYGCDYSLVGLPDEGGWIKCPECGIYSPIGMEPTETAEPRQRN